MPIKTLRGLLIAQFCGAFNDNAWKLMVALLTIRTIRADVSPSDFEAAAQAHTTLVFVIFTLPLMLVSLVAGTLADRFSKRTIIIAMKAAEVLLMAVATTVLFLNPAGGVLALVVLGCMGAHSALFSPAKYGILPEILSHERLAAGNGLLEMSTFVAIIAGTYAGGVLLGRPARTRGRLDLSSPLSPRSASSRLVHTKSFPCSDTRRSACHTKRLLDSHARRSCAGAGYYRVHRLLDHREFVQPGYRGLCQEFSGSLRRALRAPAGRLGRRHRCRRVLGRKAIGVEG